MQQGTLGEQYLEKYVLPNINRKHGKDELIPEVGNDYSLREQIVTADGVGETPAIAWNKAMNNFLCSLENPLGARVTLLLPENVKATFISDCMERFQKLADEHKCDIVGGHTQVSDAFSKPTFSVQIYGKKERPYPAQWSQKLRADIVMAGAAGILGTDRLLAAGQMNFRFPENFLQGAGFGEGKYSIVPMTELVLKLFEQKELQIYKLHDISAGGVYGALWQLGKSLNAGMEIDNRKIPIRQETIELCECVDCNPYLLDGTGGLLIVCDKGRELLEAFKTAEIPAAIIGETIAGKERMVYFGDNEHRTLAPT